MPALPRVDRIKTIYSAAKALNYGWRYTDFLKTPMYNGISRYIPQLHRITFRFCKKDESSAGMRNFIKDQIVTLGVNNPSVVIYSQPVRNQIPLIRAEYGDGKIIQVNAKNMSMSDIEKDVQLLFSRSGKAAVKLESRQSSLLPSIQGQWDPTTWQSTELNVADLPSEKFSQPQSCELSATDYVLKKYDQNAQ